jgi:hypothetical protein
MKPRGLIWPLVVSALVIGATSCGGSSSSIGSNSGGSGGQSAGGFAEGGSSASGGVVGAAGSSGKSGQGGAGVAGNAGAGAAGMTGQAGAGGVAGTSDNAGSAGVSGGADAGATGEAGSPGVETRWLDPGVGIGCGPTDSSDCSGALSWDCTAAPTNPACVANGNGDGYCCNAPCVADHADDDNFCPGTPIMVNCDPSAVAPANCTPYGTSLTTYCCEP